MRKLSINELRNIVIKEVKKAKQNQVAQFSNQFGWGVSQKEHIETKNQPWHFNLPVFKKFMFEMFGLGEDDK